MTKNVMANVFHIKAKTFQEKLYFKNIIVFNI